MATADRYSILFEPVEIGPKTAPNRFWQTPHASGYGTDFADSQAEYRGIKADGGWGVIFTEATSLAPETEKGPQVTGKLWDDGDVQNSRRVVERIHAAGALAGIELEYHSSTSYACEGRLNARGVVPVAGEGPLPVGYAATTTELDDLEDIEEVQELHVAAALRAVEAGFDLITFHCGHSASLLAHFLIPYYNTRTDEYGGSLENRARFARETLTKVRAAVGSRAAVGLRLGVDTLDEPLGLGDRGIRADGDAPRFIQLMDDLVDYWDLIIGGIDWGQDAQSSRTARENHEAPYTGHMKQYTSKPVVNVGRLNGPDTMVSIIRSGQCDFIGAARATISDPYLPEKVRTGRIDEIRECIGCNMCVSRIEVHNGRIICTQNATVGEEWRRGWHPEKFTTPKNKDKSVLIVGAGPAGLECATVLARRGMEMVHLVDGASVAGGCLNWITKLPGRAEWRHVLEYREHQIAKLGNVELILNTQLSVDDVLDYGAEIIIIATGSHYSLDGVDPYTRRSLDFLKRMGDGLKVPEQVMNGDPLGERVVVVDTDGYFVGPGVAEHLARLGHKVSLLTPADTIGYYLSLTLELPRMLHDLHQLGVDIHTGTSVIDATENSVSAVTAIGQTELAADSVVLVGQRRADADLYRELNRRKDSWSAHGIDNVYRIGDCARPSFIADAIFSGHRLAREIDTDNPARPLPYLRDRRVVDSAEFDYALNARSPLTV